MASATGASIPSPAVTSAIRSAERPWVVAPTGMATEESDTLVDRLRRGEPAAIAHAYDRHEAHVRAFARRLVADESAAEDLVQDVFLALPGSIKNFRGDSTLQTFLVSIAINHARHHVRAAARRRKAMERYAREPSFGPRAADAHVAEQQMIALLARGLDTLPLDQRVAFVLCDVEERTAGEVADLVSVPEATVRTRLFHARRKLREFLDAEGFDVTR
jgi:RNA polymerase sigma-70 factor (ECF subfamily)